MPKLPVQKNKRSLRGESCSLRERLWGAFTFIVAILTLIALLTYVPRSADLNWLGRVGHSAAYGLRYLFGLCSYPLLLTGSLLGWQRFTHLRQLQRSKEVLLIAVWLLVALILSILSDHAPYWTLKFAPWTFVGEQNAHIYLGGVPPYFLYREIPFFNLHHLFSSKGTLLLSLSGIALCAVGLSFPNRWVLGLYRVLRSSLQGTEQHLSKPSVAQNGENKDPAGGPLQMISPSTADQAAGAGDIVLKAQPALKHPLETPKRIETKAEGTTFSLPPDDLLTDAQTRPAGKLEEQVKFQAKLLEETLLSFGIEAKVGRVHFGPTIISFEVHPAIGVKVQRIKALESDIALNMQARSIRIIAPIPGKAAVGVEVPAKIPQEVGFKELLSEYRSSSKRLEIPLLLGKSAAGDAVIGDLARMPHLIIAGATGSGKSVCINTIVMSILMNASPDEIRLLMIDPKKVELTAYSELPHMIAPVITEAPGACEALNWLVKEMERRYEMLRRLGLRNIGAFNERRIDVEAEKATDLNIPLKLPYIVGIVDELADLMMSSSSDIETPITRIAQMARAVGIHLILATQRPSREVITGLIKANFPARISFKVANRINSQIILDEVGAESLLGNGDMLFLPPGTAALHRAQGAYMRDEDINRVVSHICKQAPAQYLIASFDRVAQDLSWQGRDKPSDPLFDQALQIVSTSGLASTTFLQRKLKIGYARAASLMDLLETKGVISAQEGSKPRRVLITSEAPNAKGVEAHIE